MKSTIVVVLTIMLIALIGQSEATNTVNCTNVNGDMFFNKCMMNNENVLPLMASFIMQFVNPRAVAETTTSILLILPAMLLVGYTSANSYPVLKNKFNSLRIVIVHMLHRISYSLVLGVGLYAIFRQRRPCFCDGAHVGSIYGMPSGDAMAGGLLGAYLIDRAPFYPAFSRIAGVLLMISVCFERTILGYHSVGQVVTGTTIGFILHYYSTRVPQWVLIIDIFAQWILSIISLQVDSALVYASNDPNNLFVWFVWGVSFQVLVLLHFFRIARSSSSGWSVLKESYNSLHQPKATNIQGHDASDQLLSFSLSPTSDDQESKERFDRRVAFDSDIVYTVFAFIPFLLLNFFSFCMQNWNWFVKINKSTNGGTHM